MAARGRTQVLGREVNLFIKKTSGGTFTLVGCADDISIKRDRGAIEFSCRAGGGKIPDGKDPDWSFSVKGLTQVVAAGDEATSVTFKDFFNLQSTGESFEAKVATGTATGDAIFTGTVFMLSFELSGSNSGISTYSVELPGSGLLVMTTAA